MNELKNFATNILLKLVVSHILGSGISLLVTAYCDNSRFMGVVTLKSSGGVFALEVFLIRKQITLSTLFFAAY